MPKADRVDELLAQDTTGNLRRLHDRLVALGLKTKMPPNSQTLLFEASDDAGRKVGLAAMRSGYVSVFSFPKTYWRPRLKLLEEALSAIGPRHFVQTQELVSESQYSARQLRVSPDIERELMAVVEGLIANHAHALSRGE